jgi:hypothetical protein
MLAFVDIALHRRSPADLPASQFLLALVLLVDLAIGVTALQIDETLRRAAALLLFDTALYFGAISAALRLFGKPQRFLQTATALVGTDVLLNTILLPLLLWNHALDMPPEQVAAPRLLILLLFFWNLDIGGYVFSQALDRAYVVGVSVMIVYVLTSMALREALFPMAS